MSDRYPPKNKPAADPREPDFAARLARAEFGRHYVDPVRIEQALRGGEIVFQDKAPRRGKRP